MTGALISCCLTSRIGFEGVYNALCHEHPMPGPKRLNGKIQEVKTIGPGKFENFRSAILFFCGGLDLYPQQCRQNQYSKCYENQIETLNIH